MPLPAELDRKLDAMPKATPSGGPYVKAGTEEAASTSPGSIYLYVDYGLLRVDSNNNNHIWGNWRTAVSQACDDQWVNGYVDRRDMITYDFVMRCAHHTPSDDGIWRFTIR